jgi:hypothetical protein
MAAKYSLGLRNALAVTGSLKNQLDGCFLRLYAGTAPASPNDAIGAATLLCEISNGGAGGTFEATASDGTLVKSTSETWSGNNVASGTATFFRLVKTGDAGDASTSAIRIQGTVGVGGVDMQMTNPTLVSGAPQAFDYFYLTMPEQ